jgi:hypothetical protein
MQQHRLIVEETSDNYNSKGDVNYIEGVGIAAPLAQNLDRILSLI